MTYEPGAAAWDLLADGSRRDILGLLARTPLAVGELAARLPISRPAVSQHLKVLKEAGVVVDEERGTRRIYSVDDAALIALKDQLDTFWGRTLTGFATSLDAPAGADPITGGQP